MTMPSNKRSHAATLAGPKSTIDASKAGARLTHSLSKSLHNLLQTNHGGGDGERESQSHSHQQDVYHQYLNSPPKHSSSSDRQRHWTRSGQAFLSSAMTTVGVGSNSNTLNFWREYGRGNEEAFADGRYLVWFVKEILIGIAAASDNDALEDNGSGRNGGSGPDAESNFGERLMGMLEQWHLSILDLLNKSGPAKANDGPLADHLTMDDDADEDESSAGVMWQMLLHNAHLTPESLLDAYEKYTPPQDQYEQSATPLDDIDEDVTLPAEYFSWPSFFHSAVMDAEEAHSKENGGPKRRRSNTGGKYYSSQRTALLGGEKNHNWWPLLGYAIAYAFLESNNSMTTQQKVQYLKENVLESLPTMMGIATFDYNPRNSLLSGILACVLDEMSEWVVLDGLMLDESEVVAREEARINEEVCDRMRASVGQIVELLVVNKILSKLANLIGMPLANLVGEASDALLNYSVTHHRLRIQSSAPPKDVLQEHLIIDAKQIVAFIERANPELKNQLQDRKFNPAHYFSGWDGSDSSIPDHPITIYNRALLRSDDLPSAAKLCSTLEDSSGIDEGTNKHCYFLLYEKMQDTGVLFEDSWNEAGVGATLANIPVGALGRQCALEYLENIVLEAKESLFSSVGTNRNNIKREQAKHELLCVKDAVRRTILKFLVPRAYSPYEALSIATELSDARSTPQLEHTAWGRDGNGNTAVEVACRILAAPSLYSVYNENLVDEEEEEIFEEGELLEVEGQQELVQGDLDVVHEHQEESEKEQPIIPEEELPHEEHLQRAHDVPGSPEKNVEEEAPIDDKEEEVIDLGDSDEEEEAVAEPPKEDHKTAFAAESDETKSVENSVQSPAEGEDQTKEQEGEVTYPPHYHQFPGNYSESDDYEEEDDEEADRHVAYEGEYDEEEGRGESEDEEGHPPARQQPQVDEPIELLDSSEEEEEEADGSEVSSGDESDETKDLNEKVDQYIESHVNEGGDVVLAGAGAAATSSASIANESDQEREQQEKEARILSEAVHEFINPVTGEKERDDVVEDNVQDKAAEEEPAEEAKDASSESDEDVVDLGTDDEQDKVTEREPAEEAKDAAIESDEDVVVVDGADVNPSDEDVVDYEPESPVESDEEVKNVEQMDQVEDEVAPSPSASVQPDDDVEVVEVIEEKAPTGSKEDAYDGEGGGDDEAKEELKKSAQENLMASDAKDVEEEVEEQDLKGHEMEDEVNEAADEHVDGPTNATAMEADSLRGAQEPSAEILAEEATGEVPDVPPPEEAYSSDHGSDNNLAPDDTTEDTDDLSNMLADDEHESIDTEDDKRSLAEVPSQGDETFDDAEEGAEAPMVHGSDAGEVREEEEKPSVLVAAAMSSQLQGNNFDRSANSFQLAEGEGEGGNRDNESFDHTSAAMASTDADLWENYDDASQGGEGGTDMDASNVRVIARYHGQDLAIHSVVDVHADADDTGEDSSPEDSKAAADAAGGRVSGQMSDDGYIPEAEMTEEERADRARKDSNARMAKKAIDDGYMPDAEATEEEHPKKSPKKEERVMTKHPIEDEGYIPDASEASEVEQMEVDTKPRALAVTATAASTEVAAARDVRFEADLETPIPTSQSIDDGYLPTDDGLTEEERVDRSAAAAPPSIDEGYIPDDALTEEERVETRRRRDIDHGYLPDGHTTPGEATEEDQGEEVQAAQELQPDLGAEEHYDNDAEMISNSKEEESEEAEATAVPTETRLDDTIDEGYLPSAVEGTEEELSEKEETTRMKIDNNNDQGVQEAKTSPVAGEEATMPSVLVATATALQQQGPSGQAEAGGIAMPKDDEPFSDESGEMKMIESPAKTDDVTAEEDALVPGKNMEGLKSTSGATDASATPDETVMPPEMPEQKATSDDEKGNINVDVNNNEEEEETKPLAEENDDEEDKTGAPTSAPPEALTIEEKNVKVDESTEPLVPGQATATDDVALEKEKDDEDGAGEEANDSIENVVEATTPEPVHPSGEEDVAEKAAGILGEGEKESSIAEAERPEEVMKEVHTAPEGDADTLKVKKDSMVEDSTNTIPTPDKAIKTAEAPAQKGGDSAIPDAVESPDHPDKPQQEVHDFSRMKVAELKDKLRELGLPVSGRKQELIDRLNGHLYPNLEGKEEGESTSKAPSKSSMKRKAPPAQKKSRKAADQLDTPISEISHPAAGIDSEIDDESVQEHHFTSGTTKSGPSPGVPSSIAVTRRRGGKLAVVPEGEIIEGSTLGNTMPHSKPKADDASTASSGSKRSTPLSRKDDNEEASNVSVSRRRAKRSAAGDDDDASNVSGTSTRRSTRGATKRKALADDGESTASTRRSTRSRKAPEDGTKEDAEEGSVASRRSARGTATRKKAAVESSSVGTRRSTRSRSKK